MDDAGPSTANGGGAMRRAVLRGGTLLAAGSAGAQVLSFLRNLIIGRMLSPEDFGIAGLFAVVVSFIEITSDLAVDKLLVQADDGDEPKLQATAHLLQVTRGLLGAVVLWFAAPWVAAFFGAGASGEIDATSTFALLALVPAIRCFQHLDVKRYQRHMRFAPGVALEVGAHLVAAIAAAPFVLWIGNYEAALWLLVVHSVALTIGSHLLGERRYAWALDGSSAKRIIAFGWPLLANGLLMFFVFQGDKAVIGRYYENAELGVYLAVMMLAQMPSTLATKTVIGIGLPVLSRSKGEPVFDHVTGVLVGALSILGAGGMAAMIAGGDGVVQLVWGRDFAPPVGVAAWLGIMWGTRLLRVAPTLAAMAHGDTATGLIGNIGRAFGLAAAVWLGVNQQPLWTIAAAGAAGEAIAMIVTGIRLVRKHGMGFGVCGWPMVFAASLGASAWVGSEAIGPRGLWAQARLASVAGLMVAFAGFCVFAALRGEAMKLARRG